MPLPTQPFTDLLPLRDQPNDRIMEFMESMQDVMDSLIQHGERQTPYYDLALMEADTVSGLRDLRRVASILGVRVTTRFGEGFNVDDEARLAYERSVYRRAIETAVGYYRKKGIEGIVEIVGYILNLSLAGKPLNTHDYQEFLPDEDRPIGYDNQIVAEDTGEDGDDVTTNFIFTVGNPGIQPYSLRVFDPNTTGLVAYDDGAGNLAGQATGTVDYTTGAIDVTFVTPPANGSDLKATYETTVGNLGLKWYRSPHYQVEVNWVASVSQFDFNTKINGSPDGNVQYFELLLDVLPVPAGTTKLSYTVGGTNYVTFGTSNGDGTGYFAAAHVTDPEVNATINYNTGVVEILFNTAPDDGSEIRIDYGGYNAQQLLDDLLTALEDIRPAHVVFKILFVIAIKQIVNINALAWWHRQITLCDDETDPFDYDSIVATCYQYDANNYVRRRADGNLVEIVIGGDRVADLTYGAMRVQGTATTAAGSLGGTQTSWNSAGNSAFIYNPTDQRMYLGFWTGDMPSGQYEYEPIAYWDNSGNFVCTPDLVTYVRSGAAGYPCSGPKLLSGSPVADTVQVGANAIHVPYLSYSYALDEISLAGDLITLVTVSGP